MAPNTNPQAFKWDKLADPISMPSSLTPGNVSIDVLSVVPEPIRSRAELSLAENTKRVAAKAGSTADRPRVDYIWDVQPVASVEMGEAFVKLITKYAKYRPTTGTIPHAADGVKAGQATARCGNVGHYRNGEDGKPVACDAQADGAYIGVRYSVRPFEQRKDTARAPGASSA